MLGLLSNLGVGFALTTGDAEVVAVDRTYAEILGRSPKDALGVTMSDVTHPDDLTCNRWMLDKAKSVGTSFDIRKRYRLVGGDVRWVENHVVALNGFGRDMLLVASRPIAPTTLVLGSPPAGQDHATYIGDMCVQLAAMAESAHLTLGAELLRLAAVAIASEAGLDEAATQAAE